MYTSADASAISGHEKPAWKTCPTGLFFSFSRTASATLVLPLHISLVSQVLAIGSGSRAGTSYQLLWKILHVPSGHSLDILDDHFEALEVYRGYSIETDIEKDERPFKKGVDGISFDESDKASLMAHSVTTYLQERGVSCAEERSRAKGRELQRRQRQSTFCT